MSEEVTDCFINPLIYSGNGYQRPSFWDDCMDPIPLRTRFDMGEFISPDPLPPLKKKIRDVDGWWNGAFRLVGGVVAAVGVGVAFWRWWG